ncbi:MAG: hypothetical protein L0Z70_12050 [Chloroflexi bacterium]|nr:hypothetical protein [Chloroflexota bacterium]
MSEQDERHLILEMIAAGKITAGEGLNLLKSLEGAEEDEAQAAAGQADEQAEPLRLDDLADSGAADEGAGRAAADTTPESPSATGEADFLRSLPAEIEAWRHLWLVPLWIGVSLTLLGAAWMYTAWLRGGIGAGFVLAWAPFLLGVGLSVLGWQSRTARWLHLRVEQGRGEWPRRFTFSFPLPLGLARWGLAIFGGRIPGLHDPAALEQMIAALETSASPQNPFYITVDEQEDGEKVQIYIG